MKLLRTTALTAALMTAAIPLLTSDAQAWRGWRGAGWGWRGAALGAAAVGTALAARSYYGGYGYGYPAYGYGYGSGYSYPSYGYGYGTGYSYPAYTGYSYPAYGYGYGTGYSYPAYGYGRGIVRRAPLRRRLASRLVKSRTKHRAEYQPKSAFSDAASSARPRITRIGFIPDRCRSSPPRLRLAIE